MDVKNQNQMDEMLTTLRNLRDAGEITELRILGTKHGVVSGYFQGEDGHLALCQTALRYNEKHNIYITLNPVLIDPGRECTNSVAESAKQTTKDDDISKYSWLLIDLDPVRASNLSSTDGEHEAALSLAMKISKDMMERGWPQPIIADSGNGAHLLWYIDLSNNQENRNLINRVLNWFSKQFSNDNVEVDTQVGNPARIIKLYGTYARKGISSTDRPHRQSKILSIPDKDIFGVEVAQLKELANVSPGKSQNTGQSQKNAISRQRLSAKGFLDKHQLEIVKEADYKGIGTIFTLKKCPWNPAHTNQSAFLIEFLDGGIMARCHHTGCSHENWKSLRLKMGEDVSAREIKSVTDELLDICSDIQVFKDAEDVAYALVPVKGHEEVWRLDGSSIKHWLRNMYLQRASKAASSNQIDTVVQTLISSAIQGDLQGNPKQRLARIGKDQIYYHLADADWNVIEISSQGCLMMKAPPFMFVKGSKEQAQAKPTFPGDLYLIKKYVSFEQPNDELLFLILLVSFLLPEIPHPILILHGEKGSAKTTLMRMIQMLIDPSKSDVLALPKKESDLFVQLHGNYLLGYDNLEHLAPDQSNMFCTAITGGAVSKRKLYTDSEEVTLTFKNCIMFNGINIIGNKPDLLERAILIKLPTMDSSRRRPEEQLWEEFNKDRGAILGGAMTILSQALAKLPSIQPPPLPRMADFARIGFAVAEAMGGQGHAFLTAYEENLKQGSEEAVHSSPLATLILDYMKDKERVTQSVAELYNHLKKHAFDWGIDLRSSYWPGSPNHFSRKLLELKASLATFGLSIDKKNSGLSKVLTIENNGYKPTIQKKSINNLLD